MPFLARSAANCSSLREMGPYCITSSNVISTVTAPVFSSAPFSITVGTYSGICPPEVDVAAVTDVGSSSGDLQHLFLIDSLGFPHPFYF